MKLSPNIQVHAVTDLTPEFMKAHGLSGLLLDLDNTLAPYRVKESPEHIVAWLDAMREQGFKLIVCSNSKEPRVKAYCQPLRLPYVHTARKPSAKGVLQAVTKLGFKTGQVAMVGDQIFTDTLAGRRAGVLTVLVDPLKNSFIFRLRRLLETPFLRNSTEKD